MSKRPSSREIEDVVFQALIQRRFCKCGCGDICYGKFSVDEVFPIRLNMSKLEKGDKDMLILGRLQVFVHYLEESVSYT